MHTLLIKVPTKDKDYNKLSTHLSEVCHSHGDYLDNMTDEDCLDRDCPISGFHCPFPKYDNCHKIKPDDWFKIIIIDSKPWD